MVKNRRGIPSRKITVRPRRQVTLPSWVCEAMNLKQGDELTVNVTEDELVLTPVRRIALDSLREIQEAFAASGISEEDLQEEGRRVRDELIRARYGNR